MADAFTLSYIVRMFTSWNAGDGTHTSQWCRHPRSRSARGSRDLAGRPLVLHPDAHQVVIPRVPAGELERAAAGDLLGGHGKDPGDRTRAGGVVGGDVVRPAQGAVLGLPDELPDLVSRGAPAVRHGALTDADVPRVRGDRCLRLDPGVD